MRDSIWLLHIQNRGRGREERERKGESGTGSAEKESTKRRKVEQGRGTGGWVKGEGKTKEGEGRISRVNGGAEQMATEETAGGARKATKSKLFEFLVHGVVSGAVCHSYERS